MSVLTIVLVIALTSVQLVAQNTCHFSIKFNNLLFWDELPEVEFSTDVRITFNSYVDAEFRFEGIRLHSKNKTFASQTFQYLSLRVNMTFFRGKIGFSNEDVRLSRMIKKDVFEFIWSNNITNTSFLTDCFWNNKTEISANSTFSSDNSLLKSVSLYKYTN